MAFKENLLFLRKSMNLSQEELADKIKVSRQVISKWENGQSTPDMEMIIKLSDLFKISVDQLLVSPEAEKQNSTNQKNNKLILKLWTLFLMLISVLGFVWLIIDLYFSQGITTDTVTILYLSMLLLPIFIFAVTCVIYKLKNRK